VVEVDWILEATKVLLMALVDTRDLLGATVPREEVAREAAAAWELTAPRTTEASLLECIISSVA
jgi:hypothetical protein